MLLHKQDFDAITQRWNRYLYYKQYQRIVLSVGKNWELHLQTWRRHMTPSHVKNCGKLCYRNQIYHKIQYRLYVTCMLIVCVLLMMNCVVHIINIQLIWELSKEMEPPQNSLYYFLIDFILTYYNTSSPEVLIPSSVVYILLLHYKYLCLPMLMIQFCLLPHLRSYRHYYNAYKPFVMITR